MESPKAPPTGLMWHYTDAVGFFGITTERRIRATHIDFLNDRTEGVHAAALIKAFAAEVLSDGRSAQETAWLESLSERRTPTFVVAMTVAYDRLDSWRAYANGGVGYALGFAPNRLHQIPGATLRKCVYVNPKSPDFPWSVPTGTHGMPPELAFLLTHHDTAPADETEARAQFFSKADVALARFGPELKHAAFHEEQEYRLVLTNVATTDIELYPSRRGRLVPFVWVDIQPDDLQGLLLGPGLDDPDEYAARRHLDSHLFRHVKIHRSTVPLRAV